MKVEVIPNIYYEVRENIPLETLFQEYTIEKQFWRRQDDFPAFFYDYDPHLPDKEVCKINAARTEYRKGKLITLSVEDTQELIRLVSREVYRMTYGIFIMNKGEKIYFPGPYYGMLQFCKLFGVAKNDGYGEHRAYQRLFATARQLVIENEYLDGYYCTKPKKTGISQEVAACHVVEMITHSQFTAAVMSKAHDTCKKANFKYFQYSLKHLPPVLRPKTEQKNWQNAVQKIELKHTNPEYSVDNTYAAIPTTSSGTDGLPPTQRIHIDEPPKFPPSVKISEVYTKSKEQIRMQQIKIGIIEMTAYTPEEDSPAFKWCRDFYYECCKMNENEMPANRVLPIFIGITESSNGTFDIYGEPDRFRALTEEQAARAKCKTAYELQARLRQYPITAKESWQSGGSGSVFDNIALAEQKAKLEDLYRAGEVNYIEYDLDFSAGTPSKLLFHEVTVAEKLAGKTGTYRMYCTREYMQKNTNLCFSMPKKKRKEKNEIVEYLQPQDDVVHCSGNDPVDYAFVSQLGKKQSKNASVIKDLQGNLLSIYLDRPEDPEDGIMNLYKHILFWGAYSIIEGNRPNAVTMLEKLGLVFFILIRASDGKIRPYKIGDNIKHVSSGKETKSLYVGLIIRRIKHNIHQYTCMDIVSSHQDFEPDNTQEYDISVADGWCEVCIDALQTWILSKKSHSDKYLMLEHAISALG